MYWWAFPLRRGIATASSLPERERRHLFRQYHHRFSRNIELIFLVANQVQRHGHARAVTARVKNDPSSFAAFQSLINEDGIVARLKGAI